MTKPTIPDVVERFSRYHQKDSAWGSLHVVLADPNYEDHFVRHCIDWAEERGDTEGAELGRILLQMSKTQRGKLSHKVREFERAQEQA